MKLTIILSILALCVSCGVKGDPIPPRSPKDLGRGQPTYKGATEELAVPKIPPVYAPTQKEDENTEKK